MPELNFTPEQRFMISLICDLYKKPEEREIDPKFVMSAISGGHDWAIDWELGGILPERVDTREDVSFVTDVLDMWEFIELSWDKLDPADQQKVHDGVPYLGKGPKFIGFDGNNETQYMAIANMLVDEMNRFATFKGRSLNSHSPKIDRYRDMLASWPGVRATLHKALMTPDQLIELLSRD